MIKDESRQKGLTVVVKTTHECMNECIYCSTELDAEKGFMDYTTLNNMIFKISEWNVPSKRTVFIWHGGDPLLMSLNFYKNIVAIQKDFLLEHPEHKFFNDVQTSGMGLEKYIDFFAENDFSVGMSLDGPKHIQDVTRPKKGNNPSFDEALRMVKLAKEKKVGGGVICLLNTKTRDHLEEIYSFFKKEHIHHKVNIMLPMGRAKDKPELALKPTEAGKAMIEYFDMWFDDHSTPVLDVAPFTEIIHNLGASKNQILKVSYPVGCTFRNDCANTFISVVPGGNVYPCGRFSGTKDYRLGNINTDSMDTLMASEPHTTLLKRHYEGVESCKNCDYLSICNSGCPDNANLYRGNAMLKDGLCAAYHMMFEHIENRIRQELVKSNAQPSRT